MQRTSDRFDLRALGLWFLLGAVSLIFYVATYERAHPEAAVNLTVSRAEAVARTKAYIERRGGDVSGHRHAVGFHSDWQTKKFLDKELGLDEAMRLMRDEVRTWYWYVRWFVPSREEEFRVGLAPDGRLVSYSHVVPEAAAGASLDEDEARVIAEAFLDEIPHVDRAVYTPIEAWQEELPARTRHHFTWKRTYFEREGATYRVAIGVDGGDVGSYSEYLHVPEEWTRGEARKLSQRSVLYTVANAWRYILHGAALAVLLAKFRSRQLRVRFAVGLGMLMVGTSVLSWVNDLPFSWMYYQTTDSVAAHYGTQVLDMVGGMLGAAVALFALAVSADAAGRDAFAAKLSLSRVWTRGFWRSKEVFMAVAVGLCLGMAHSAYCSAFYLSAKEVGAWCPIAGPRLNAFATPMPWVYPFVTGLRASLTEEIVFRLFAISLLLRLTRRRWLAVVLPAVVWAFLHSMYPQEPVYIRGLELTGVGIVFGLVFLRYGLMATFVSHYTYNAMCMGTVMMRTGDPRLVVSAAIVVGLMAGLLVPGLLRLLRGRPLAGIADVLAQPLGKPRAHAAVPAYRDDGPACYSPFLTLPAKRLLALVTVALAGVAACLFVPRAEEFGDFMEASVTRWEACALADTYIEARGVAVGGYRTAVHFHEGLDGDEADFVWQHLGMKGLNEAFRTRLVLGAYWCVHYFTPGQIEGYRVRVGPGGKIVGCGHLVAEEAPGAQLTREEALSLGESFLRDEKGISLDRYRLVDSSAHEYDARTDHWFTWEDSESGLGEGTFRLSLMIQGDEPMYEPFVKIPDEWTRARDEQYTKDMLMGALAVAAWSGLLALAVVADILFRRRAAREYWHMFLARVRTVLHSGLYVACVFGAVLAASRLVIALNLLGTFWTSYSTASSAASFAVSTFLRRFGFEAAGALAVGCSLALAADIAVRFAFPSSHPVAYWAGLGRLLGGDPKEAPEGAALPLRRVWGEALLIACLLSAALLGAEAIVSSEFGADLLHRDTVDSIYASAPAAHVRGGYDSYVPALHAAANALQLGIAAGMAFFIVATLCRRYVRHPLAVACLCITCGIALASAVFIGEHASVLGSLAAGALLGLVLPLAFVCLVRWVLRGNLPAYVLLVFVPTFLHSGIEMLHVPDAYIRWNGAVLVVLFGACCLLGGWLCVCSRASGE